MWMDIAQEGDQEPRSDEEDTVYDRTNPFQRKTGNPFEEGEEARGMLDEPETRCGFLGWRPHALQKFANKTIFSVIFTIVAIFQGSFWTYFTANISTYEKRFHIDSTSTGLLLLANELSQILVTVLFSYFGVRRHRAKLLTLGVTLTSLSCFLMASPHYFLGSGQMTAVLMKDPVIPTISRTIRSEIPNSLPLIEETTYLSSLSALYTPEDADDVTFTNTKSDSSSSLTTNSFPNTSSASSSTSSITTLLTSSDTVTTGSPPLTKMEEPTTDPEKNEDASSVGTVVPYINDEMRTVWPMCNRHTEDINFKSKTRTECDTKLFERRLVFGLIFVANFIGGVGSVLYLLSGGPFSEESTILPNELPRIFGITMSIRLVGTFFGYLFAWSCLSEFVHPTKNVLQIDSRWLGAYWLGWTCLGIFMTILAVVLALFPRQSPRQFLKRRSLTHETGLTMLLLPELVSFFGGAEPKAANLFPSVLNIPNVFQGFIRNKIYVLLTFSSIVHIFVGTGYYTFLPKYLEYMFRVKVADAAILTGMSSVPLQVAGLMLGGAFVARYLPSCQEISYWNVIVTALQVVGLMIMAFLGCSTDKIDITFLQHQHQLTTLSSSIEANSIINLTSTSAPPTSHSEHCSADCDCHSGPILPVCDEYTGTSYYSPCHAGCEKSENQTNFLECSCLEFDNVTLTEGFCKSDTCSKGLIAFIVFVCLIQFLNGTTVVGKMLLSYKSLQTDQRAAIIGFTFFILSVLAIVPSPVVFGNLFESSCLIREGMCDSNLHGNCWLYSDSTLRFAYNLSAAAFLTVAFILDALLWKTCSVNDVRLYDGELRQLTQPQTVPAGPSRSQPFTNVAI